MLATTNVDDYYSSAGLNLKSALHAVAAELNCLGVLLEFNASQIIWFVEINFAQNYFNLLGHIDLGLQKKRIQGDEAFLIYSRVLYWYFGGIFKLEAWYHKTRQKLHWSGKLTDHTYVYNSLTIFRMGS